MNTDPKTRKTETVWTLRSAKPISFGRNKGKHETAEFRDSGGDYIRFRFGSSPDGKGNDINCPAGRYDSVKRQDARDTWNRLLQEGWVFVNSCVQWDSEEFMDYGRRKEGKSKRSPYREAKELQAKVLYRQKMKTHPQYMLKKKDVKDVYDEYLKDIDTYALNA
tara:strand:- start:955 stop:1446 length:492 start_codon:yes stop_codon:yes gene_type:complete